MKNLIKKVDFKVLQERYIDYIDVKPRTVETYNTGIRQFLEYLKENNVEIPTREDIIGFRDKIQKNHSISTVNSYLIAIRNFFSYLEYEGIYKNITKNVKGLVDTNLHKKESLSAEQCKEILNSAKDLREKTLFALTLSCGLRANEIVNIRVSDFKEKDGVNVLYLLGKGRSEKTDFVVVPDNMIELLKEYVKKYNINDYLFVSSSNHNTGGKLNTCTIRRIVNAMFERVGVKKDTISLHSLRHTFATLSIKNGEDIRQVSQALRHKSVAVTEIYLHDLNAIENKCSNVVSNSILGGIM